MLLYDKSSKSGQQGPPHLMTNMSVGAVSQAIRCTYPGCKCECFSSSKNQIRTCQNCKHGWVAHALDKLISSNIYPGMAQQTEPITPSIVFDIASLVLYDCQAIPIRIKFSLDRLFSSLQHDEVLQILHGFGWSYEDYARGYILQDPTGRVLEKWNIIPREEEAIVLQQFLRFNETRKIAQEQLVQETKTLQDMTSSSSPNTKSDSDIRKFIERNNMALIQSYNLALRRAFDNPQYLFSAMTGGLPAAQLNMAAAAQQFGRLFPPTSNMMPMPPASFPQNSAKAEPINPAEQIRKLQEPCDLSLKRSPESQNSCSPALSASAASLNQPMPATPTDNHRSSELNTSGSSLRKTTSPMPNLMKRPASPSSSSNKGWPFNNPAFGQTVFVTASGKKRVLCTACNKTFCDKGALKIHYSAVHLKEMHQCTIPGCNMMFSSRRSRNRHSANPNPKLHTPQTRRPRERYDSSQDQMMAMLNLKHDGKSVNGEGGSYDPIDLDKSTNSPDDYDESQEGFCDDEYMDDELPTQVKIKQESPLYGSSKRKSLMPTRVPSSADLAGNQADSKSDGRRSAASDNLSGDNSLDIDVNDDSQSCGEPGEVRTRSSSVEPGEVVRHKGEEKKLFPGFPAGFSSPDKQAMHLFSSFLPQKVDNNTKDFWANFIQQSAAAQKAASEKSAANDELDDDEELNVKDTCDDKQHNQTGEHMDTSVTTAECKFCDKTFPSEDLLDKHMDSAHHGDDSYSDHQTSSYNSHLDSLKNKTPPTCEAYVGA